MRKILFGLAALAIVGAAILVNAGQLNRVPILEAMQTNNPPLIWWGTNSVANFNRFFVLASATVSFGTNLMVQIGNPIGIPTTTVNMAYSGSLLGAGNTSNLTIYLQRSFNKLDWFAWTNVDIVPNGLTAVATNFTFTVGEYHYIRISDFTNANSAYFRSNRLEFFYK